nr:hypothetical protein CFP56_77037 [Quercus suber]
MRNVDPVLVTPMPMQSEQVESDPHEVSQPVLNEGCQDIDGQVFKSDNFDSQLRDIDRELTKFDTPSTPKLVTSSALDRLEDPSPLSRGSMNNRELSFTSVQPTKLST